MNVGTIVEASMLKVRLVRSRGGNSGRSGPIATRAAAFSVRSRNISSRR